MRWTRLARVALLVIVLAALLAAHVAAAADAVEMKAGDFNDALAQAAQQDKPLIIDFYADW